jgi:tetratricopeptide (TPR) repeat protein
MVDARSDDVITTWSSRWEDGESPSTAIAEAAERLAISVTSHLHWMHLVWAARNPPQPEAFRAFITGINKGYAMSNPGDETDFDESREEATALLMKAMALEPGWARPKLFAVYGFFTFGEPKKATQLAKSVLGIENVEYLDELLARFHLADSEYRYVEAFEYAYQAHKLAPRHTHLARWVAQAAIKCNRPHLAVEVLGKIPLDRLDPRGLTEYATGLHLLGRFEEELAAWREYEKLHPSPGRFHTQQGILVPLAATGQLAEIESLFSDWGGRPRSDETLAQLYTIAAAELKAHGFSDHAFTIAARGLEWIEDSSAVTKCTSCSALHRLHLLDVAGNREEIPRSEREYLAGKEEGWWILAVKGVNAARCGDTKAAREYSELLAEVDEPYLIGQPTYIRAAIAARLGDTELAMQLLKAALTEGFPYGIGLHRDWDLEPLWDDPEFQEILRPKG